jgi:hypothetical protein
MGRNFLQTRLPVRLHQFTSNSPRVFPTLRAHCDLDKVGNASHIVPFEHEHPLSPEPSKVLA